MLPPARSTRAPALSNSRVTQQAAAANTACKGKGKGNERQWMSERASNAATKRRTFILLGFPQIFPQRAVAFPARGPALLSCVSSGLRSLTAKENACHRACSGESMTPLCNMRALAPVCRSTSVSGATHHAAHAGTSEACVSGTAVRRAGRQPRQLHAAA